MFLSCLIFLFLFLREINLPDAEPGLDTPDGPGCGSSMAGVDPLDSSGLEVSTVEDVDEEEAEASPLMSGR